MADAVPDFGPMLLIQVAVGIAFVVPTLLALWRTFNKPARDDTGQRGAPNLLLFDGPLKSALDLLQGTYRQLVEMRDENEKTVAEFRQRHESELDIMRGLKAPLDGILEELKLQRHFRGHSR